MSQALKIGEVSIEELGLLMGGVHGNSRSTTGTTEHLHAHPI
jgi:hypothetical protein